MVIQRQKYIFFFIQKNKFQTNLLYVDAFVKSVQIYFSSEFVHLSFICRFKARKTTIRRYLAEK